MIINATGTLSAREALAAQSRPVRAPIVETFLLAEGRIGYLAVEGPGANPSAADLAVEAYRLIAQDPALSDVAFQSEPQAISIGQGCASVTMNVTDASLSALSAAVTTQIQRWLVGGFPVDGGRVLVGSIADDGMSQTWQHHAIQPWSIIPAKCKSISVRLSPHARAKIESSSRAKRGCRNRRRVDRALVRGRVGFLRRRRSFSPFFGVTIAMIGCYYGMQTRGGTEGVGRATTRTVVVSAIAILVSDFFLTKLFMSL